ncbi:MAG: L-seryl-tRNA(Sec) selenium transferase, partial [Candidatus Eremiobacterota bacterium]
MRLRDIPSIDVLLARAASEPALATRPRPLVTDALRLAAAELRDRLREGDLPGQESDWVLERAEQFLHEWVGGTLDRVVNATGVVLHTNLGRAPLAREAVEHVSRVAAGYSNLEFNLDTGERGSRYSHLVGLLTRLTGAESALVVNNNAAAMLLLVDELARDREVICSRGELVEIGGSFRVPDVLARGGARLVEVGTTNKTYVRDYRAAATERTGMLLSTHMSNFLMLGFVHQPDPRELVELARELGVPAVLDLGSGLLDEALSQALGEPSVSSMVRAGFDLVAFSGDKLLGGPQCGVIVGREELVRRLARNPLTRALRVDKLTVAALEATLRLYLEAPGRIPVLKMLRATAEELKPRAEVLAARVGGQLLAGASMTGGGSLPGKDLPTWLVRLAPRSGSEEDWAVRLRRRRVPVVVRRSEGALLVDVRT